MSQSNISDQQMKFIQEYQKVPNASMAAVNSGYSQNSSRQIGYRLLNKPKIKEYLASVREASSELANLTAMNLITEIQSIKEEAMFGEMINDRVALNCIHLQAKLLGCYEPGYREREFRKEQEKRMYKYNLEVLSKEERSQLILLLAKSRRKDENDG